MSKINLAIELAVFKMRNPSMNAAGVLSNSTSLLRRVYESGTGAVVTKSLGPRPRKGHPNPTFIQLKYGALNAMGLPNPGVDLVWCIDELKKLGIPVVGSFFGGSLQEFSNVAYLLSKSGVDALDGITSSRV